jgi:hypothetical protein
VPAEIGEVGVEGHPLDGWPAPALEAGRRADVFDAAHPGCVVPFVVLRAERLEAELFGHEFTGHDEVIRN